MELELATINFIERAENIHKGKYSYEDVIYTHSKTKIIIICFFHGKYEQMPPDHLRGSGCINCGRKNSHKINGELDILPQYNTETFITYANIVHNNKYNYDKVKYTDNFTHIIITCPVHNDFTQLPHSHLNKLNGCSKCVNEQAQKINKERFINKAIIIHGDKYNYDNFIYNSYSTKGEIICKIHGIFLQSAEYHITKKHGCKNCGLTLAGLAFRSNTTEYIEKAIKKNGDFYDYSLVKYDTWETKIIIICKIHGQFSIQASKHLEGHGCKKCGNIRIGDSRRYNNELFITRANKIHNNIYDYSRVNYFDIDTEVIIGCNTHGYFTVIAAYHLNHKIGCKKCRLCPSCQLWDTNGKLCSYCIPKSSNKKYQKTKEYEVVRFLKDNLPDTDFIHNKSVGRSCTDGHLFPDILFDCNWYFLIVEVDERKHSGASYSCDERRMFDVIAKLGMPCIFIRYNPDSKKSDKQILLDKVNEYLTLTDKVWNDYGFKVNYLFYD